MLAQGIVEGLLREKCCTRQPAALQGVSHNLIACKGKEQRCDDLIDQRFVVVPFVDATLSDIQAGVDAGHMCGSCRGELRGQFRDNTICKNGLEKAVALCVPFKEAPAEGIDEKEDHCIVACR